MQRQKVHQLHYSFSRINIDDEAFLPWKERYIQMIFINIIKVQTVSIGVYASDYKGALGITRVLVLGKGRGGGGEVRFFFQLLIRNNFFTLKYLCEPVFALG